MRAEDPESYLRRFAEAQLRRLAAREATAAECASAVDAVAAAFEGTGVLDREHAEAITADLEVAFAARSPERGTLLHTGRRPQLSAVRVEPGFTGLVSARIARQRERGIAIGPAPGEPLGDVSVRPAGAVLRERGDGTDEDVYLLSYVATPGRASLTVAARTTQLMVPRRHASPPSGRNPRTRPANPRPSTFAGGGMTAVDDTGRRYELGFSGGGGRWHLGRLTLSPAPPPDIAWLEVRCGGQSAMLDLRAAAPTAEVTARPRSDSLGEAYLLRRAEVLLGYVRGQAGHATAQSPRPAAPVRATASGLASAAPGLRAVGLLPDASPVPGQLAALIERMGGPGRLIAEPAELPDRWAAFLSAVARPPGATGIPPDNPKGEGQPVAAAHLAPVLPEVDGAAVHLAGLVTLPGEGTLIFGELRARPESGGLALWLRDDAGGWHAISVTGWSATGSDYTFQAAVEPPFGPEVSRVELYVAGPNTEVRADVPLTWWTK